MTVGTSDDYIGLVTSELRLDPVGTYSSSSGREFWCAGRGSDGWDDEDLLARSDQTELLPGDGLNGSGIFAQAAGSVAKRIVLRFQLLDSRRQPLVTMTCA